MRYVPLLLAFVFCLTGCREALVDAPPAFEEEPQELEETSRAVYLKGPDEMRMGTVREFRAEPVPEATRYVWEVRESSTGNLRGEFETDTEGRERVLFAEAIRPGAVYLRVSAFSDTALIGVGERTIRVGF